MRGRPRAIANPDILWNLFEEYVSDCKSRPVQVQDYVGKDGKQVYRDRERPLTFEGFCNYVFKLGIIGDLAHYFSNLNNAYSDFLPICSHIRRIIRQDQVEGGMTGIYNTSITQRLNNLVEKTENKSEITEIRVIREG
jgi:hypothetical protein